MTTSHTRTRLALLCSHTDIHPPANSQSRVTTWNQTQTAGRINVRQQGIKTLGNRIKTVNQSKTAENQIKTAGNETKTVSHGIEAR